MQVGETFHLLLASVTATLECPRIFDSL